MEAQPTGSKPAPGSLALVQDFVNSVDFETGVEALDTPEGLREWLRARDLLGTAEPVTEGDLRRSLEVREGLRALLLANNGAEVDERAVTTLDRAAARAGMRLRFHPGGGSRLEPDATGVDGALARILARVAGAMADGSWPRLKACPSQTCLWAFYDRSKNRSGRWCTMADCGNRSKVRAYRERRESSA